MRKENMFILGINSPPKNDTTAALLDTNLLEAWMFGCHGVTHPANPSVAESCKTLSPVSCYLATSLATW